MRQVTVDNRERVSLAKLRTHHPTQYLAEEYPDGTIVMTPAEVISSAELAILRDPKTKGVIDRFLAGDTEGEPIPDSFLGLADQH